MVRALTCPGCGIVTGNCFGKTGNRHKPDCPYTTYRMSEKY